ncbi:hypothetical protein [Acidaminococcus timonensis]|uniref:hypothetical protein n=1 Tax=Acidaminococcus timonensis TaxID=1871002 RepID=UPI00307B3491
MKKYDNFCRALKNLKKIQHVEPPYDTITQTGMISEETLWLQAGCFFPWQPV